MYFFVRDNQNHEEMKFQLEIGGDHTIVDWKMFCREVLIDYFINHPLILGGEGIGVEIDEAHFVKRKYERGHLVRAQRVFGIYEPVSRLGFVIAVPDRSRETLICVILRV